MFSVRVVTVNHYLSAPITDLDVNFADFRKTKVTQVPVIRIFGSTPAGQKTCLHIHGVFPYFYVPCDDSEVSEKFLQQLALSIDTGLQVGSGNASKYVQHVFKIIPVSGRQLYGYRSSERQFLKIYFYNPLVIRRASELLQSGAILNRVFQPYECHVPFNLQFFIDYNLYGMNLVNLAVVKFRRSENDGNKENPSNCSESQLGESSMFNSVSTQHWDPSNIPGSQWLPEDVKRQSICELEVDGVATDILNRLDLKDNVDTNPGLIAIWEDERQRREQLGQMSQLMPPASPERGEMPLQEAEGDWLERLSEVIDEQLKELEEHLPASEGDASKMENKADDEEEKRSDSVVVSQSNQLVDHLSQGEAFKPQEGNVEAVVNEELALSLSQVSATGLSQAADKDLANLLMELGQGDDIDSDSILSTQTPAASQEAVDGPTENAAEEGEEEAEKQESVEMSQVWLDGDDDDGLDDDLDDDLDDEEEEEEEVEKEEQSKDGEDEPKEKQEHNSSREEPLIPDVEEMSAFSQPELRCSQLPQLDGPNDPVPEKRRKKSKLQMVQEMRAIRASHQLTRSLPPNVNPPASGCKSPTFSHALNFGGTNMNLSGGRKGYGPQGGRPPWTYSQSGVGFYSQSCQQSMDGQSFQNRTQSYVGSALYTGQVGQGFEGGSEKKLVSKNGKAPSALKQKLEGFETPSSQDSKHQSHISSSKSLTDINQDGIFERNGSSKSLEKKPKKKRGRPPLSSKQRKEVFYGKESEPKKNGRGGNDGSNIESRSTGNINQEGIFERNGSSTNKSLEKKPKKKRGRPPLSSKQRKEVFPGKESESKKNGRDGNDVSNIESRSTVNSSPSASPGVKKAPAKRGPLPTILKHKVALPYDAVSKQEDTSGDGDTINIVDDDSALGVVKKYDNISNKKPIRKRGRPPKKHKIQFVNSLPVSTGVHRTLDDSGITRKVPNCDKALDDSPLEKGKTPLSLQEQELNLLTKYSPSKSTNPHFQNESVVISGENLPTGESTNHEHSQKTFAVKKRRGRPLLSSTKHQAATASLPEKSPPNLEVPGNELRKLAIVEGSGLNSLNLSDIKPVKRRGRPPSKWKQKKEALHGQRSQLVMEGGIRESSGPQVTDVIQKEAVGTVNSFPNGASWLEGQGTNQNVKELVSSLKGKSTDDPRVSPDGLKGTGRGRKTLGLVQKPRKRGRPPLSLKKKELHSHHKYATNIPSERKEGERQPDNFSETKGNDRTDRSNYLVPVSYGHSDDTFQEMHSKEYLSLKNLRVKLTRVDLSQEGKDHSSMSQVDIGTSDNFERDYLKNMHEDILGHNVTDEGEETDLVSDSAERGQSEGNEEKICESKKTKPRHLGMRRPYSYSSKFPGVTKLSVPAVESKSSNVKLPVVQGDESKSLNVNIPVAQGDDVEKDSINSEVSRLADPSESAENGPIDDPLCCKDDSGKVNGSTITTGQKRPFDESGIDTRKTKFQKSDEQLSKITSFDCLSEEVTKEKHDVFPLELKEGHSINLDEFSSEQLSSMPAISPKIILYRFGKRSSPLPSSLDDEESLNTSGMEKKNDGESMSSSEMEKKNEITETEIATALSRQNSEKVSPLLQSIAQQKKYIPANSKAARQPKVSEKRGGERIEYSLLAGFQRHAKRKKESFQSPREIQSEAEGTNGDQSDVIDLTSSSPDGAEKSSPQEVEILSVQGWQKKKKSDGQLWAPTTPSGTKKKGRLSRGSRSKKKGKGQSPESSPTFKQLQFFVTPTKSNSTKSPKSSQSSKSSKKSSQNTPQGTPQTGSQTPKRGRGRPRKLKLDGVKQADDKGKQNKEIRDYFPVTKRGKGGRAEGTKEKNVGDREADKVTKEDAEDEEVSFVQFLTGEGGNDISLTGQETQLDEIIDLLKDDDAAAILNVESEIEVTSTEVTTSTPCISDEDIQAIDGKETSDSVHASDPKYPFLRTPSGSPYRDVLWNMSYTSPVVSGPRESPPKYWSPTDDSSKEEMHQSESSDQNLQSELLKSDSESQFIDSLDQNSNKEGYSGQRRESKESVESPSLSMSEIGEYGNSQMALFEDLNTTTTSEETFEGSKNQSSDIIGDGMQNASSEIASKTAIPESGACEESGGDTIPKGMSLPEQPDDKKRSSESTRTDIISENDTCAKGTDKKSNNGGGYNDGFESLIPFPTTIPDSVSEASESDEDSSPLELMDNISQIELPQSQLDSEKVTLVSDSESVKEVVEMAGELETDFTRVEEVCDVETNPVQKEDIKERQELSGRDEESDGKVSPVIDFQGTASQAKLLSSLDDTPPTSFDGGTSHEESTSGLKSADKNAKMSSGDGESDVDDSLQQDRSAMKEKVLVDEKLASNRNTKDDKNLFEMIGSLYKIPTEELTPDEKSKKSEQTDSVTDEGHKGHSFDGSSSPVLEYQSSTIPVGVTHPTTEGKMDELAESRKSKGEEDHSLKSDEASEKVKSPSIVGNSSPVLEFPGNLSQVNSLPVLGYQRSTIITGVQHATGATAEDSLNEFARSEKSKDEDDHSLKSNDANEKEESLSTVQGSSPILEFQGSASQMNSLQKIEDSSEKQEEQKTQDLPERRQEIKGTDAQDIEEIGDSGMEVESPSNQNWGVDEKMRAGMTEEQMRKDETGVCEGENSDLKGAECKVDEPCLIEGVAPADQVDSRYSGEDTCVEEEEEVKSAGIKDSGKESAMLDHSITEETKSTLKAANLETDEINHISAEVNDGAEESDLLNCNIIEKNKCIPGDTNQQVDDVHHSFAKEVEIGQVDTSVLSREREVEKGPLTMDAGDSETCKETGEFKTKDSDAEALVGGKEGDDTNLSLEKEEKDEHKEVLEKIVESSGNLTENNSCHQTSLLKERRISELKVVNSKDDTESSKVKTTSKSSEDSSVFLKFISKSTDSSGMSHDHGKGSENKQNKAQRIRRGSSNGGSKPIDLSQYGIERELSIPLRRLSLDDLPSWNQSGTSPSDDDRSRDQRRPILDFESTFMIEHSQFQLSDSSEHDKANPCDLHDLENSLNLQDSGTSDFGESCDDFDKSKGKSKLRKGRKESVLKGTKKRDKEKKKRKKSESEVVHKKKRKSDSIGGSELSSQEIEEYPPIKMVFRKVKHKKAVRPSKKKTPQTSENWKLTEKASSQQGMVHSLEGEIPSPSGESNNEQFKELKTLILRKVNSGCTGQRKPLENTAGVSDKEPPLDTSQRPHSDNVSIKQLTPSTHKTIKGLELEQSLYTDTMGGEPDTRRQWNRALEKSCQSARKELLTLPSKDGKFAWREKAELISEGKVAGLQDQLKSTDKSLQNADNCNENVCRSGVEQSESATSEPSGIGVSSQSNVSLEAVADGKDGGLRRENMGESRLEVDDSKVTNFTTEENMQTGGILSDGSSEQVFNTNAHNTPVPDGKPVFQTEVHDDSTSQTQKMLKCNISIRSRLNTAETEVIEALMGLSSDGGTLSTKTEEGEEEDAGDSSSDMVPSLVGFTEEEAHEIQCATSILEESNNEMCAEPTEEDRSYQETEQVPLIDQQVQEGSQDVESEGVIDQVLTHEEGSQEKPSEEEGNNDTSVGGVFIPVKPPPTRVDIASSLSECGLTDVIHQVPYWEKSADIPAFVRETANMQVPLNQNLPGGLKEALPPSSSEGLDHWRTEMFVRNQSQMLASQEESFYSEEGKAIMKGILESAVCKMEVVFTPCKLPPTVCDVTEWLKNQNKNISLAVSKSSAKTNRTSRKLESKDLKKDIVCVDDNMKKISSDMSHDLMIPHSCLEEAPPSPFLQELIDQVEPSTPPLIDTPESPPSRSSSGSLPCHSTPIVTGGKERPTQPTLTPILITANKKSEPRLKKRVSLADVPKIEQPKAVTPGQASMVTPLAKKGSFTSQLEGPTPKNTGAFKFSQSNLQDAKALHENQHLTLMSLELHVHTRGKLRPDPDFDPVRAIFFCIASENYGEGVGDGARSEYVGVITVDNPNKNQLQTPTSNRPLLSTFGLPDVNVINATDEMEMFEKFVELIHSHDPDFLIGYEIQQLSWGYLLDRASALDVKLCSRISRLPDNEKESHFSSEKDPYGSDHTSEIHIAGRIVLNVWRLLRHEIALNVYTFENVAYHVLHQRVPLFSFQDLSAWFDHQTHLLRWRVVEHYMYRVIGNLKILKQMDLIGRTSELARLFGIEFFSVLSRGSQYRVESMMLRQAKSQNYVALSPSVQQRAVMKAPECLPLILEPESRFYEDPVIVLDFQSLYPSMMIGYNYCFSTCIGRVEHIAKGGHFVLGCTTHYLPPKQIKQLLDSGGLHVSPNGVVFVKKNVRHGILPRMLEEILQTRIMVKKGLKDHKEDKVLQRMLDNRQLGLKLIANVTYGYTSASFSGRMPCIEVGDSIVMKARETLERSIHLIETTPKWGARVVYGDTDSVFVIVKGATKERAFEVGNEIVAAVSKVNPKPVKLKLEKVYKPCVLQAKKRYVGFKYESPDQKEPDLEAKGIETIRRDTCPAVAKILEKSLKIIFTTQNMSQVKQYVQKQFQKIIDGRINQQDLVFAKEYRGRQYYKPGACVPALELTKRSLAVDKRSEPRVGERVPYVIVNGIPGLPLIQLVRRPEELASDPTLIINSAYYITRQLVPSLNRVFGIMGVETLQWYQELPRNLRVTSAPNIQKNQSKKGTISQYFCSLNCVICDQLTKTGLCDDCRKQPQLAAAALNRKIQEYQRIWIHLTKICRNCTGFPEHQPSCISIDCPNRFKIVKSSQKLDSIPPLVHLLSELPAS